MSSTLQNMPGHRSVPDGSDGSVSLLFEMFPFLPDFFAGPAPLYVTIGLLYVVISRAERRRRRKLRAAAMREVALGEVPPRRQEFRTMGINPQLGPHGGHWGDG